MVDPSVLIPIEALALVMVSCFSAMFLWLRGEFKKLNEKDTEQDMRRRALIDSNNKFREEVLQRLTHIEARIKNGRKTNVEKH